MPFQPLHELEWQIEVGDKVKIHGVRDDAPGARFNGKQGVVKKIDHAVGHAVVNISGEGGGVVAAAFSWNNLQLLPRTGQPDMTQVGGSIRRRPKRTKRRPSRSRPKLSKKKRSKKSKKKRKKTRRRRR